MAAVNTYILSSAYSKLHYIAVTGGVLRIGEVENKRSKLVFTHRSFEVQLERIPEFFKVVRKLGENVIFQSVELSEEKDTNKEEKTREADVSGPLKSSPTDILWREKVDSTKHPKKGLSVLKSAKDVFLGKKMTIQEEPKTIELTENEFLYAEGLSLVYTKVAKTSCYFYFNHFTYMAFLQKLKYLLPFALNPTPRQFDLINKFKREAIKSSLQTTDFVYPCMTKKMTTVIKCACETTDFCRTEMFIQKHFLGLNLAYLEVLCELEKLTTC